MSALDTVIEQGIRHTALGARYGDEALAELAQLRDALGQIAEGRFASVAEACEIAVRALRSEP